MFQFALTPQSTVTVEAGGAALDIVAGWLIVIFLLIGGLVGVFFLIRGFARKKSSIKTSFKKVVLLVRVPKEAAEKGGGETKESPQEIQEHIGVAENLFNAIGGLKAEKGFSTWFFGYHDTFSFEIVINEGMISFYVVVPRKRLEFAEQLIHSQYPYAEITEVPDYNMFDPQGTVSGNYLVFKRKSFFPIKTYRKMEKDSVEGILGALIKVPKEDGAAVQFMFRSAHKEWRKYGLRVVKEMKKGKSMKEAVHSLGLFSRIGSAVPSSLSKKKDEAPKEPKSLSPLEQEAQKTIEEKASKPGLDVNIRIVTSGRTLEAAKSYLANINNSFAQFDIYEYGNSFTKRTPNQKNIIHDFIFRNFNEKMKISVNAEEMASLVHFPIPETQTPNINWLGARMAAPPSNMPQEGLIMGRVLYRGQETMVRIKDGDRQRHMYIIGKSGVGKSKLIAHMVRQDIANGKGVCVVDPHGDLIEDIIEAIPDNRIDDVIYFDPSDVDRPVGLNMLEISDETQKDSATQEMIAIFYKLFPPEMIGPIFEHNMRNFMLTLMSDLNEPGTIVEIPRMISDPEFQKYWVSKVKDPVVRVFWEKEVAKTSDFHKSEMMGYLVSKVGRFVENEMMRNIIGQVNIREGERIGGFDIREVMDKQKILLVNLSKGKIGEINANLLGLIIVSKLQMAALSRANLPESERKDFYLYIDEFQNFITDSIATILSEARKYRLNLIVAHQYMGQLTSGAVVGKEGDPKVRDAILGNAGTMCVFRIGVEDAEFLEKEFAPTFNKFDLINAEKGMTYTRLLIDNTSSRPFAMRTIFLEKGDPERSKAIKQLSRLRYGRDRALVEAEITERSQLGVPAPRTAPPVPREPMA